MAMALNVIGLAANLAGVILLFRFGMPFHVPTKGVVLLALEQSDEGSLAKENTFAFWGCVGLALICLGTLSQVMGALNA